MKILITGVHGFVGSNLVGALKDTNEIYGLDIIAPEKEGVLKTFSWEDLDKGLVPQVDAIIHLAGIAHDTKNQTEAEIYFKVNTNPTQKIYDYFVTSRAKKFIFFSTAKAAADKVDSILTEDVIPSPKGPYGESKIKAEEYIMAHLSDEKQVYILRPCMIHGPGTKGNLNLLYNVVKKGFPWPLGAFDNRRTFTSIDNLSFVINGLLTKDVPMGIYNMCDDEALSTNELIEIICQSLGKKAHIWSISKGFMIKAAKICGMLHLPLDEERLRKLTENYISSNAKIKAALGVENMPVAARDGLMKTLNSFKTEDV